MKNILRVILWILSWFAGAVGFVQAIFTKPFLWQDMFGINSPFMQVEVWDRMGWGYFFKNPLHALKTIGAYWNYQEPAQRAYKFYTFMVVVLGGLLIWRW